MSQNSSSTTRRTVVKGAAWAVPTISVGTLAPRLAASLRIDPGINGWVLNSPRSQGGCSYTLEVNSNPSNAGSTPDGAPWGLYLYDVQPRAVITNPQITYWIIGNQTATWTNLTDHGSCWGTPTRGTPQTKSDGLEYTPYTWTYSNSPSCALNPANVDGNGRLWLQHFRSRASFTQPSDRCNDVTYWTQRRITIDPYGDGNPQVLTFERRNGTRGPYSGSQARMAPQTEQSTGAPAVAVS